MAKEFKLKCNAETGDQEYWEDKVIVKTIKGKITKIKEAQLLTIEDVRKLLLELF